MSLPIGSFLTFTTRGVSHRWTPISPRPKHPLWDEPTRQSQPENRYYSDRSSHIKKVRECFIRLEQERIWQDNCEASKSNNLTRNNSLTAPLSKERLRIPKGLAKAESSLAMQMHTEKIGLADCLHRQRKPAVTSPSCQCGWPPANGKIYHYSLSAV